MVFGESAGIQNTVSVGGQDYRNLLRQAEKSACAKLNDSTCFSFLLWIR